MTSNPPPSILRAMGRILGFNGLRALAVLLVIASHIELWDWIGMKTLGHRLTGLGVPLFFVLSGFLITSLLLAEEDRWGGIDVRAFYARRALRILPLYLLSFGVLAALHLVGVIRMEGCTYLHALTHTVNFAPNRCLYEPVSHFWSLAVEEHFYLVWPLLFLAGSRVALVAALAVIVVCQALLSNYSVLLGPYSPAYSPMRWTLPGALPIAVGALAAFYARSTLTKAPFTAPLRWVLLLVAGYYVFHAPISMLWYAAIAVAVLFVFYNQTGWLTRALEWGPLAFLGTISYGIYVWQGIFTGNGPYRLYPSFPPSVEVGAVLTFIIAPVSYFLFEKPIMRLKQRFRRVPDLSPPPTPERPPPRSAREA